MTDQEFIELLNLYVDREISPEDALRLESAVSASPRRREIHDQYCRMQKACSMLSEEPADSTAAVFEFSARSSWRFGPILAGLAAACVIAVGIRFRGALAKSESSGVAVEAARPQATSPGRSDPMEAVFVARPAASPADSGSLFTAAGGAPQLNWIGDIHLAPVPQSSAPDFLLTSKADLKEAAVLSDPQDGHASQQPGEMAAFRFQR